MRALALTLLLAVPSAATIEFVPRERSRVKRLSPSPAAARAPGNPLGSIDLDKSLDALREAGPVRVGGKTYNLGIAADREFKYFFVVFSRPAYSLLEPLIRPKDFIGPKGAALSVEGKAFIFKIDLKLTDPVRGSRLDIFPMGRPDLAETWSTGEILEILARKATFFRLGGDDYYLAYLSDVDPATGRKTGTRSLLFYTDSRFRARAWTLGEDALPDGARVAVSLGEKRLLLERRRGLVVLQPAR